MLVRLSEWISLGEHVCVSIVIFFAILFFCYVFVRVHAYTLFKNVTG